jgi:hypothetical protein
MMRASLLASAIAAWLWPSRVTDRSIPEVVTLPATSRIVMMVGDVYSAI